MKRTELVGWTRPLPRVVLIALALVLLPIQLGWHLGYETFKYLSEYFAEVAELWGLE